jgi:hypothetical protein
MRFRKLVISIVIALTVTASLGAVWQKKAVQPKPDPISGDWNASLASDTAEFTLTLKLKLEGNKVTGSYESDHVGSGQISKGSWAANKLNFSLETNHGQVALTGELKQGKLAGNFDAGQMQGTWKADKK